MGSREKVVETEEEEEEGKKQQQQQGKRKVKAEGFLLVDRIGGGPSTPPPTWRLELSSHEGDDSIGPIQQFLTHPSASRGSTVSARKLCASLWEVQPYHSLSMSKRAAKPMRDKGFEFDPPNVPPDQPARGGGIQKPTLESPLRPHKYRGNNLAVQPVSSASYCSSMEVAPYKAAVTPVSSLDWRDPSGESSYSLRTSTELVKILNRIWSLEEQHASNTSLAKALKSEIIRSRARIKELLREKEKDKQIVNDMMNRVEEDKLREVEAAVKSVRGEVEEERKLRKFSESERRKLSKELSVLKSGFSTALRELERERKARCLLESLCDEFAEGIRDYDLVVRSLKHKVAEDFVGEEVSDQSILHISEAWLDERIQMKLAQTRNDVSEKDTIVDRLSSDIETFLQAKQQYVESRGNSDLTQKELKEKKLSRRHSLESFPLNEAASAPKFAEEENSPGSDLQVTERMNAKEMKDSSKRTVTSESMEINAAPRKSNNRCISPVPYGGIMADDNPDPDEIKATYVARDQQNGLDKWARSCGLNSLSDHPRDNLLRNRSLSSKGDRIRTHSMGPCGEDSYARSIPSRGRASPTPVQSWKFKLTSPEFDQPEASSRLPPGVKENTLMAKLLEARLESQHSRSKAPRSSV
ncbi:uncharacterized protein At5g41620 [Punica granatum]|uniref:Uncharacterized protein n=2 Tax=Punica granatum TaxID=22663 RepID=A0A218VWN8_PUNGR|nr:uncharacterized protein At5g41620 [Punica granatum]OWM64302.1 hypothetical protein CDL15_Pgr018874 [Punica granatum]PKI44977.1 hypothetical protein CRG98_034616 [Punica granatum]